jgi:hypothetical protein
MFFSSDYIAASLNGGPNMAKAKVLAGLVWVLLLGIDIYAVKVNWPGDITIDLNMLLAGAGGVIWTYPWKTPSVLAPFSLGAMLAGAFFIVKEGILPLLH